jgi:hypothetical protein
MSMPERGGVIKRGFSQTHPKGLLDLLNQVSPLAMLYQPVAPLSAVAASSV